MGCFYSTSRGDGNGEQVTITTSPLDKIHVFINPNTRAGDIKHFAFIEGDLLLISPSGQSIHLPNEALVIDWAREYYRPGEVIQLRSCFMLVSDYSSVSMEDQ
jgi:hypothetical protein